MAFYNVIKNFNNSITFIKKLNSDKYKRVFYSTLFYSKTGSAM